MVVMIRCSGVIVWNFACRRWAGWVRDVMSQRDGDVARVAEGQEHAVVEVGQECCHFGRVGNVAGDDLAFG